MRILQVIDRFDFGGSENHVCDLANHLSDQGNEVFVASKNGYQTSRLHPKVVFIDTSRFGAIIPLYAYKLYTIVKQHGIDVIHAHRRSSILAASIAGYFAGVKVIATVHGRPKYDLRSRLSKTIPHRLVFVSNAVFQGAIKRYSIEPKSVYIPNGLSCFIEKLNTSPFSIYHVSRIDNAHYQTITLLINKVMPKLLELFPQATLKVIGDGKMRKQIEIEANVLNKQFDRQVCDVLGYVPEITDELIQANLLIGVGRVALHGLLLGIPLISVNSKRFGGTISTENYEQLKATNFVDTSALPPKSLQLYEEVVRVFSNMEERLVDSKKLQLAVLRDFSMDTITQRIVQVYQTI